MDHNLGVLVQIDGLEPEYEDIEVQSNDERSAAAGARVVRASSYIVYVDLPGVQDEMLLVHGYTGAYDKVSRMVATYLRSLEARRPPKPLFGDWTAEPAVEGTVPAPSDEVVQILKKRGYLTAMSVAEEEDFFYKLATRIHQKKTRSTPSYIFMPTYNCNLRCSYCFQDHMRTSPNLRHLLQTMSPSVADRVFLGIPQIESLHGVDSKNAHRDIGFFGGEPLLASNRPVIEHIINKGLQIGTANFWAISNATELDAYEDILAPDKISSIQITLDGPPSEHDRRRIYPDGSGSFERIAKNITMALDKGVMISIRMNVDRNNVEQLPDLAAAIHEHGWDHYKNFSAYTAPIRAMNANVARSTTLDTSQLSKIQAEITKKYPIVSVLDRPDISIKQDARYIFHGDRRLPAAFKESFCSAHTGMYIFDSFGDVYVCWEKTGDASLRIGHVQEDGRVDLDAFQVSVWRDRTVASNPVCRKCRYALHCGGGCAVLAYRQSGGEYHANYCDGFATTFRNSVAEAYIEHISGVPLAAKSTRVCDQ